MNSLNYVNNKEKRKDKLFKKIQNIYEEHNLPGSFWYLDPIKCEIFTCIRCPQGEEDPQKDIEWLELFAEVLEDGVEQVKNRIKDMKMKTS